MSSSNSLLCDEVFITNNDDSSDYTIARLSPPRKNLVRRHSTPEKTENARGNMKIKKRKTRKTRKQEEK